MRTRLVLALTLLASAIACNSSTSPSSSDFVGGYTMTRYNGSALPYTQIIGGTVFTVNGGAVNVLANGTWNSIITVTPSSASSTATGTYTTSGNTITFTNSADASKSTATLSGSTLTATSTGTSPVVLVFVKN